MHEICVGTLPAYVMDDVAVLALEPINNEIQMSDHQLRHSLRDFKTKKGVALSIDTAKKLPDHLSDAQWFYDSKHNNILAIFEMNVAEIVGKSVVVINFKKKKESLNVIVTSGIINPDHLRNERYREIKNTP
jgi:hypothetical protein